MSFVTQLASIPSNAEASQIIPTVNSLIAQINSLVVNPLNEVIYPTIPAAPVNLLGVTVGNTGSPVYLTPNGASVDTNVGLILGGRGSGVLSLGGDGTSAAASLRVINVTSSARQVTVSGSAVGNPTIGVTAGSLAITPATVFAGAITVTSGTINGTTVGVTTPAAIKGTTGTFTSSMAATSGGQQVYIRQSGGNNRIDSYDDPITVTQPLIINASTLTLQIADVAKVTLSSTGIAFVNSATAPAFIPNSATVPTNGLYLSAANTPGIASNTLLAATFISPANAANWLQLTSATSAAPAVEVAGAGASAEVFLKLTPKGTSSATVQFGNATCFSANATQLNLLASLGPANSHSDVQKWLRIIDQAGISLFIPCF